MNAFNYLFTSIKNEIFKLKKTFAFWLAIISALFIPVVFFFVYLIKYEAFIPKEGVNPWFTFMKDQIMYTSSLLIPFFIVLITSLIIQIEHKSSSLKYLFTLPIPKWSIYFGKLIVTTSFIFSTYILFLAFMLLSGYAVGVLRPELNLLNYSPDLILPSKLLFRSFIAILGVAGLQFAMSFRIKNFIVPLGIGMVLVITGLIVAKADEAIYFPYAHSMRSIIKPGNMENLTWFHEVSTYSVSYFAVFSLLGYIIINRMNVK